MKTDEEDETEKKHNISMVKKKTKAYFIDIIRELFGLLLFVLNFVLHSESASSHLRYVCVCVCVHSVDLYFTFSTLSQRRHILHMDLAQFYRRTYKFVNARERGTYPIQLNLMILQIFFFQIVIKNVLVAATATGVDFVLNIHPNNDDGDDDSGNST